MTNYRFYVQMDGMTFGPYSALEIRNLDLLDDIMVTEESMNGQWLPACRFDFDDMVRKEMYSAPNLTSSMPAQAPMPYVQPQPYPQMQFNQPQPYQQQPQFNQPQPFDFPPMPQRDTSVSKGLCVLGFFLPLVGWILYFVFRETKPNQASAICKWAWIGATIALGLKITLIILHLLL